MREITAVELSKAECDVLADCLTSEAREMSTALNRALASAPAEPSDFMEARWKSERLGVCMHLLERIGEVEPRSSEWFGYAGTAFGKES